MTPAHALAAVWRAEALRSFFRAGKWLAHEREAEAQSERERLCAEYAGAEYGWARRAADLADSYEAEQ